MRGGSAKISGSLERRGATTYRSSRRKHVAGNAPRCLGRSKRGAVTQHPSCADRYFWTVSMRVGGISLARRQGYRPVALGGSSGRTCQHGKTIKPIKRPVTHTEVHIRVVLQSRKQFGELQRRTAGGIGSDGVGKLVTKTKQVFGGGYSVRLRLRWPGFSRPSSHRMLVFSLLCAVFPAKHSMV